MNTMVAILFVAWGAIGVISTLSAWHYTSGFPLSEIPESTPPVAVIVAVKNASDLSRAFFDRLRHQTYPDYRIIAAVESEEDPAFAMVAEELKRPGAPLRTVVAGKSEQTGQKVWNCSLPSTQSSPAMRSWRSSTPTRCRRPSGFPGSLPRSSIRGATRSPVTAGSSRPTTG